MTDLPPVVEGLLLDVVADGFTVCCCGPRAAPTALAASYEWKDCVDHLTIRRWKQVTAARLPKLSRVDVFTHEVVIWAYQGPAGCTLRALLDLVHPQHPNAPTGVYPAPRSLQVPRHEQRPMTIRLPSADRAGVRAARLAGCDTHSHHDLCLGRISRGERGYFFPNSDHLGVARRHEVPAPAIDLATSW